MSSIEQLLAAIPLVSTLGAEDIGKLAAIARVEDAAPGTLLFQEGSPSDAAWLVAAGRVGLSMACPGRPDTMLLTVGPGELVGWSGLGAERVRVATGRVVERATLIRLPADELSALCEADHDVGYAVMRLAFLEVARRLHDTRLQLLDMFGAEPCP